MAEIPSFPPPSAPLSAEQIINSSVTLRGIINQENSQDPPTQGATRKGVSFLILTEKFHFLAFKNKYADPTFRVLQVL
jgi:hypothetical protein